MVAQLKNRDLYDIPNEYRGPAYRHIQQRLKDAIQTKFQEKAKRYAVVCQEAKIGRWEIEYNFVKSAKILGMTTSGLAKNRALLQSLNPKIVLIEEAAETLEAYVSVACIDSLEHLILVGDHLQLRGHCHVQELEHEPFFLDVSMFERLVRNRVEFSQLLRQRRMVPEIRRGLQPIYPGLTDHQSVLNRPTIPGMGEFNTFFFSHEGRESSDTQMSKCNLDEANMVVSLFYYLCQNGTDPESITVLTFYNGQRKAILRMLRQHPHMTGGRFKVATIDSYQGEENEIIILSLVRSNEGRNIGFLVSAVHHMRAI